MLVGGDAAVRGAVVGGLRGVDGVQDVVDVVLGAGGDDGGDHVLLLEMVTGDSGMVVMMAVLGGGDW